MVLDLLGGRLAGLRRRPSRGTLLLLLFLQLDDLALPDHLVALPEQVIVALAVFVAGGVEALRQRLAPIPRLGDHALDVTWVV